MKHTAKENGSILFLSMILLSILTYAMVSLLSSTQSDIIRTRQFNNFKRTETAADAGADKAVVNLWELAVTRDLTEDSLNNLSAPDLDEYTYTFDDGTEAFSVTDITDASIKDKVTTVTRGTMKDRTGYISTFRIISAARNTTSGKSAAIERTVQLVQLPMFQFGVFYENDLDIHPGEPLFLNAPIHTNRSSWMGNPIRLKNKLTAAANVRFGIRSSKNRRGDTSASSVQVNINDNTTVTPIDPTDKSKVIDHTHEDWQELSQSHYNEQVQDSAHGVEPLELPFSKSVNTTPHAIIERADSGGDASVEKEKFANKADIRLVLNTSNELNLQQKDASGNWTNWDSTEVTWQTSGPDASPTEDRSVLVNSSDEVIAQTVQFGDARENNANTPDSPNMYAIEVDVSKLNTLGGTSGKVIYLQNDGSSGSATPAVRLSNAETLPSEGLSIASPNPLYIKGNYNTTTYDYPYANSISPPSMIAADAVTILSDKWKDSESTGSWSNKATPSDIYVNGIVFTGDMDGSQDYNGGLENLLRFLENWNNKTVNFSGGMMCMWRSTEADGKWEYGSPVYTAPVRNFFYDPAYANPDHAPPGIPKVATMETLSWNRISMEEAKQKINGTNPATPLIAGP